MVVQELTGEDANRPARAATQALIGVSKCDVNRASNPTKLQKYLNIWIICLVRRLDHKVVNAKLESWRIT
jgi:hypothetical protein